MASSKSYKIYSAIIFIFFFIASNFAFAQKSREYSRLIKLADSLYSAKKFNESGLAFSDAFKVNGWLGYVDDRYKAACSWALAGVADSAFFNLERIVYKGFYTDEEEILADEDLNSLHNDSRWIPLLEKIRANKNKQEASLTLPLVQELDTIYNDDQNYRQMIADYQAKYSGESPEMMSLWTTIKEKDSINLVKVKAILNKYGWLGADSIGQRGSTAIFLVIQHADLGTQEKYLPMMKEAVKKGKARPSELALLIDRIEMRNERPQVYGSQITKADGKYVIYKILDEANVNKRRAEVGLEPLEDYVAQWGIDYKLPSK